MRFLGAILAVLITLGQSVLADERQTSEPTTPILLKLNQFSTTTTHATSTKKQTTSQNLDSSDADQLSPVRIIEESFPVDSTSLTDLESIIKHHTPKLFNTDEKRLIIHFLSKNRYFLKQLQVQARKFRAMFRQYNPKYYNLLTALVKAHRSMKKEICNALDAGQLGNRSLLASLIHQYKSAEDRGDGLDEFLDRNEKDQFNFGKFEAISQICGA